MEDFDPAFDTEYLIVKFIFGGRRYFAIRYVDRETGLLDEGGRPLIFRNLHDLLGFADDMELTLGADDAESHHLDDLAQWAECESAIFDPDEIIHFWNISDDFARAAGAEFSGGIQNRKTENLYEKLFWGCDFPGVEGDSRHNAPSWSQAEMRMIKSIVREGIAIISSHLPLSSHQEGS